MISQRLRYPDQDVKTGEYFLLRARSSAHCRYRRVCPTAIQIRSRRKHLHPNPQAVAGDGGHGADVAEMGLRSENHSKDRCNSRKNAQSACLPCIVPETKCQSQIPQSPEDSLRPSQQNQQAQVRWGRLVHPKKQPAGKQNDSSHKVDARRGMPCTIAPSSHAGQYPRDEQTRRCDHDGQHISRRDILWVRHPGPHGTKNHSETEHEKTMPHQKTTTHSPRLHHRNTHYPFFHEVDRKPSRIIIHVRTIIYPPPQPPSLVSKPIPASVQERDREIRREPDMPFPE